MKKDYIEKTLELGAFLTFSALVITVTLQVITRFMIPNLTLVWTEEGSRFLFVYSIAFGAPLAMKRKEYVNVDIVLNILPGIVRELLELIIYIASILLFVIVLLNGIDFAKLGIGQSSPTLGISMSVAYSSIAITSLFIVIYGVLNLIGHIQDLVRRDDRS